MTKEQRELMKLDLVKAEQELVVLKSQEESADRETAIHAKEAEIGSMKGQLETAELRARNESLEAAVVTQRTKDAKAAVKEAVRRGAIASQNTALQAKWEGRCIEDPENIVLLSAMNGAPVLQGNQRITLGPVSIKREDSLTVLNAYGAEKNAKERARIYATEIRKRLDEGDPMPLHAATVSLGTLAGTLVSQRTLELLKFQFPILSSISTDFSDQQARLNQTVDSRIVTIPEVESYDPANGWPDSNAITTDVPVTLTHQEGVQITFTSDQLSSTVRRLFDEFGPAQAYSLAKSMVDGLYALFLAANYTQAAIVSALIDWGRPALIDVGSALDDQGVPDGPMNRFCLLNTSYYGALKKDQAIISLAAFQEKGIIEGGVLPEVEGFRVIKAPNLPATANLKGFAGSKSAALIASRVDSDYTTILPGASYGNVQTVTDPDNGVSVLQVQFVNHQKASATQRISLLWGVHAGQDKAGRLIKSA